MGTTQKYKAPVSHLHDVIKWDVKHFPFRHLPIIQQKPLTGILLRKKKKYTLKKKPGQRKYVKHFTLLSEFEVLPTHP